MGARTSRLTERTRSALRTPATWWGEPETPRATYSSGATVLPVCPMSRSLGRRPSSTTGRVAPTEPSSRSASSAPRPAARRRPRPCLPRRSAWRGPGPPSGRREGGSPGGARRARLRRPSTVAAPPASASGRRLRGRGSGGLDAGEVESDDRDEARPRRHVLLQPAAVDRLDEGQTRDADPPRRRTATSLQPSTAPAPQPLGDQRRQLAAGVAVLEQDRGRPRACATAPATAAATASRSTSGDRPAR